MSLKPLGRTGLKVSALCFGTMSFGGEADAAEAARMFAACRDRGINFFDCADVYSARAAERILGRLINGARDELVITSKCGYRGGAGRDNILTSVEASLTALGTDRLDVIFMHRWDPGTPLEETLRALETLVADGKVRHLGASNYAAWQIAKGLGISERHGWPRFEVIQPMYSLVKRQAEVEILPLARAEGLGVTPYSPLGGGILSGKYAAGATPQAGRLAENDRYATRYGAAWMHRTAERFAALAQARGVHPVSLAVAWAGGHPDVTAAIIGARDREQLEPSLNALEVAMGPDLRAEIAALSRTPPPATDRLEEQA